MTLPDTIERLVPVEPFSTRTSTLEPLTVPTKIEIPRCGNHFKKKSWRCSYTTLFRWGYVFKFYFKYTTFISSIGQAVTIADPDDLPLCLGQPVIPIV